MTKTADAAADAAGAVAAVAPELVCIFDTETSGLPRQIGGDTSSLGVWDSCRLVEICWVLANKKTQEVLRVRRAIVKPVGFIVPESASRIHGITHEQASTEGEELADVLGEFIDDVGKASVIVAHNMNFDDSVIRTELVRCKMKSGLETFKKKEKCCTMLRACEVMKQTRWPKLAAAYLTLCGKTLEGAHQATNDTLACMEVYFALCARE